MRDLKPKSTNWCLPAVLLLSLTLFVVDDATAQRRKRVDARRNPTEATVEEPGQDIEAGEDESSVSALKMFVYPAEEQSPEQQERDEAECTAWAQDEVGEMPATSTPEEASANDDSGQRRDRQRGGRGGLKGAAVGAVVGEALDDDEPEFSRGDFDPDKAGDKVKDADSPGDLRREVEKATRDDGLSGAETGALVGAVAGRRRQSRQQQSAAAAEAPAEPAESAASDSLRSAIQVCLESRGYRVDY